MMRILCLVALIAIIGALASDSRTLIAKRAPNAKWQLSRVADDAQLISFTVLLKQRNLEKLERTFWDVSNPNSQQYGAFLTQQQIDEMVSAAPESVRVVVEWLASSGVSKQQIHNFGDYMTIRTTVGVASKIFQAEFGKYKSSKGRFLTRVVGEASVPAEVMDHIDFVSGISELLEDVRISPKVSVNPQDDDPVITPAILKQYYQVPANAENVSPANSQGIAAFQDSFARGALVRFDQTYNISRLNYTWVGPDCITEGESDCDSYESDLDMQYVTALGEGVSTFFLQHENGQWILDWALGLQQMKNPPLVNSISYGWSEIEQCDVTTGCQTFGYNSTQYVTRCNTELQKIGARGLTVLVSDGDDGAPSLGGASGNCPMNTSTYCLPGGCEHTSSMCNEITITYDNTTCFFPMGLGSDACQTALADNDAVNKALKDFLKKNEKCKITFEVDRDQLTHVYSECNCSDIVAVHSGKYNFTTYTFDKAAGSVFNADYPTSSPYVTSVGATQFVWQNNKVTSEIGASIATGAIITTGGGFSSFQAQPSYQAAAVGKYLSSNSSGLPPSFSYDSKMRAYPDISFNGHHYNIFATEATDDCPCTSLPVDGTSCSSPALAGLISLINGELLKAGKSPVGFLNPLLYKMAVDKPSAFTDITKGDNKCNRSYCCNYGWTAAAGWDPVSGLGSPVYDQMRAYILSAKGVRN